MFFGGKRHLVPKAGRGTNAPGNVILGRDPGRVAKV